MRGTLEERFWSKVEPTGFCWNFTSLRTDGYGQIRVGGRAGTMQLAHRVSYELLIGPIAEGLQLDHLCLNHACVNPDHLDPVPSRINTLRGQNQAAKRAKRTHCPKGHPYSETNTYHHPQGHRRCRICHRERQRETS